MIDTAARILEIDCFRGLAILAMVAFHLIVDLHDFWGYPVRYEDGVWYYIGNSSALAFMFIAGTSATLNGRSARHGVTVFTWGLAISLATYIFNPNTYVRFGILHLLGSSMLVYALISRWSGFALMLAGSAMFAAGQWAAGLTPATSLLLPLGMTPAGFVSIDYYPFLPWGGVFFYGAAFGKTVYHKRRPLLPRCFIPRLLPLLGRHSLVIYLSHQPLLLALLWLYHHL